MLSSDKPLVNTMIYIADITGKEITHSAWNANQSQCEFDMSGYMSGVYFVTVADGTSRMVLKLIMQH
jgi:hypothetical protein